jgi:mono/diheme cytochrome c family protein
MRTSLLFASLLATIALGCGKSGGNSEPAPEPTPATATAQPTGGGDPVAKAKEVFSQRCVPCHGSTGAGDGPASAQLQPKPRAFGDAAWQASVTDDHIMKIVQYGGGAVGKAVTMPGNPDLSDKAVLAEIAKVVRSFKK